MRGGNIDRVKRNLLRAAVAENVDTIRGLPPRALRPSRRAGNAWLRRLPLLILVPLTLFASSYLGSGGGQPTAAILPAPRTAESAVLHGKQSGPLEPISAAAFPLFVRRVVIDAGHGGHDPGATSAMHLEEKNITLDVAGRLQSLL